jgi:hypothetical protein
MLRVLGGQRARLARAMSSAAGDAAPPGYNPLPDIALVGAFYVGAAHWLYKDYLEQPKQTSPEVGLGLGLGLELG